MTDFPLSHETDIVERLRDHQISPHHGGCGDCYSFVMDEAADEIERLRGLSQRQKGLIDPAVLMDVVQARINDYVELNNRGDLTEHGDHGWLVVVNLQRDMEFALKRALSDTSTDRTSK